MRPVAVIIPCCDEEEALPALLTRLDALRETAAPHWSIELVFVDDGSGDRTLALLNAYCSQNASAAIVRHETNQGIAAAIESGVTAAQADIVAVLDADLSYNPDILFEMIPRIEAGADVVTASPYHRRGGVEDVPAWRIGLSRIASRLYRLIFRTDLATYTACVRVYRKSAIADLRPVDRGFVGVTEILAIIDRRGGVIEEEPAILRARQAGASKMKTLRVTAAHLRLMVRILSGRVGSQRA